MSGDSAESSLTSFCMSFLKLRFSRLSRVMTIAFCVVLELSDDLIVDLVMDADRDRLDERIDERVLSCLEILRVSLSFLSMFKIYEKEFSLSNLHWFLGHILADYSL